MGKGNSHNPKTEWDSGFPVLGTFIPLNHFCSQHFPSFSLSYWEAITCISSRSPSPFVPPGRIDSSSGTSKGFEILLWFSAIVNLTLGKVWQKQNLKYVSFSRVPKSYLNCENWSFSVKTSLRRVDKGKGTLEIRVASPNVEVRTGSGSTTT